MALIMNDDKPSNEESLLEFPCDIQVKAMGLASADFEAHVISLVKQFVPEATSIAVTTRPSRSDKYISVSCQFVADSRDQLDKIYQSLSDDSRVLVAL
jgi:uncharacterized protein